MNTQTIRRNLPAILGLAGLGMLLLVQRQLELRVFSALILAGLLAGWGIWGWCIERQPPARDRLGLLQPTALPQLMLRAGISLLAFSIAFLTWRSISGNTITGGNVAGWLSAVALWVGAWWSWERPRLPQADLLETRKSRLAALLLLGITIFGGWLLFHRLYNTPNDMTQDHPWKLLDIQQILDGGRPLFFPNNTGREPGQFYYIALLIKLFNLPPDFMALKLGNVIIGTITIPIVYLLGRELGGRKLGLIAASLYAMSKWALATTRMGLRYPYAPLPAALVLWHLLRYVRMGKRTDALLAGIWLGVGLYGYIGIRIVPLVIIAFFGLMLFDRRRHTPQAIGTLVAHGLLLVTTTALLFLPLGHFMIEFPDQFWYRVATRTTDKERSIEQTVCQEFYGATGTTPQEISPLACKLGVFAYNNLRMFKGFNWEGDISQVNAVSKDILVDLITATLLLAAVPLLLWRLFRERSLRWWMVFVALPILLMTSTLNIAFPIENPSTPRAAIVMPLLFVVAAAPLALLAEWIIGAWTLRPRVRVARWALAGGVVVALLAQGVQQNYERYFKDFHLQYQGFVPNSGEIAGAILAYEQRGLDRNDAYILVWPYWLEGRSISVYMGNIHWHETHAIYEKDVLHEPENGRPLLYLLNQEDSKRRDELQARFPTGELKQVQTVVPNRTFYTFFIPGIN
ncbi:MAG: glycosyltransferase family 39 protein [Herpetosiphonaceae bacterium]|nr:glycosyltransferase family 39 protein [Herpetosiphonaceae bacterium]